jgi:ribosomal-protein-alanine N-acetyltransferase
MGAMGVRPASTGDIDDVLAIERESFPSPWSRETLVGHLGSGPFLVYERGRKVVGYLIAVPARTPLTGRFLHLLSLAVKDSERWKGIASALLEELLRLARERGFRKVILEVRKGNTAALTLYRRFGFVKKAELLRFYSDGDDAYLMELRLDPERTNSPCGAELEPTIWKGTRHERPCGAAERA